MQAGVEIRRCCQSPAPMDAATLLLAAVVRRERGRTLASQIDLIGDKQPAAAGHQALGIRD